jgi:hypothetical protein
VTDGADRFALRFPFRPVHQVTGEDDSIEIHSGETRVELSLSSPYVVLRVESFSTEEAAAAFIPRIWGAVAWMSVDLSTGFTAEMTPDPVTYADDPDKAAENLSRFAGRRIEGPVHGLVNGNFPSILPLGKTIRFATVGDVSLSVSRGREQVAASLAEGLRQPGTASAYADERLKTAIELFSDSDRESSLRSKFVTLISALEVLAPPTFKHPIAQQLIDEFKERVSRVKATTAEGSDERHALESLERELLFRREASIRSRVRELVLAGLPSSLPAVEREERARRAVSAYDDRGTLLHDGTLANEDLVKGYDVARLLVRDLLLARMQGGGPSHSSPSST